MSDLEDVPDGLGRGRNSRCKDSMSKVREAFEASRNSC